MPREDYEERKEARIDRLNERSEKASAESNQQHATARSMAGAIPFGQPILVGHHSEGRDRRYRAKIESKFRKSFEAQDKAKNLSERASAAESNTAISSDDPQAIVKLRERLTAAEESRDADKAANKLLRKAKIPVAELTAERLEAAGVTGSIARGLIKLRQIGCMYSDNVAIPGYQISNATANIKRMKDRLAELTREFAAAEDGDKTFEHEGFQIVHNVTENRVQMVFPGKPDEATRSILKAHGFRWSRYNGAWQRQLNQAGRNAAEWVAKQLSE